MMAEVFAVLFSYLLGSIPTGLIVAKLFGKGDIRTKGSGNIGATNTWRIAGKIPGLLTLILDVLKGALPVLVSAEYFSTIESDIYIYCGMAAAVGHMFPIWLNFKGGKGVATAFGALSAVNFDVGVMLVFVFIASFMPFRVVSIASIVTTLAATVIAVVFLEGGQSLMIWTFAVLILYKHRSNISRILKGEERKI